jgi:hypothetical protein
MLDCPLPHIERQAAQQHPSSDTAQWQQQQQQHCTVATAAAAAAATRQLTHGVWPCWLGFRVGIYFSGAQAAWVIHALILLLASRHVPAGCTCRQRQVRVQASVRGVVMRCGQRRVTGQVDVRPVARKQGTVMVASSAKVVLVASQAAEGTLTAVQTALGEG